MTCSQLITKAWWGQNRSSYTVNGLCCLEGKGQGGGGTSSGVLERNLTLTLNCNDNKASGKYNSVPFLIDLQGQGRDLLVEEVGFKADYLVKSVLVPLVCCWGRMWMYRLGLARELRRSLLESSLPSSV